MKGRQRLFADGLNSRGKFVVLRSPDREFIFGDGFCHNLVLPSLPISPKIFVPLTPRIALLYVKPQKFYVEPRLSSLEVDADWTEGLNLGVHVYAKDAIYFRSDQPPMTEYFSANRHGFFASSNNAIDELVDQIPGIHCNR